MERRICPNCNGAISLTNFTIHEAYCTRSLVKCSMCGEMVRKTCFEEHLSDAHTSIQCERCFEAYERCDEAKHREVCALRSITCQYCDLLLPVFSMPEHQEQCGCRTELCTQCGKFVMKRELLNHACLPPVSREKPSGDSDLDRDFDIALQLQCMELSNATAVVNIANEFSSSVMKDDVNGETREPLDSVLVQETLDTPASCAPSEVTVPCGYCNGSFQVSQIQTHQAQCCQFSSGGLLRTPVPKLTLQTLKTNEKSPKQITTDKPAMRKSVGNSSSKVDSSGDTVPNGHPIYLSRPGKLSELRPLAGHPRPTFLNSAQGSSNGSNSSKPNSSTKFTTKRPAYELPPVRDPRTQQRKSSLSSVGNVPARCPPGRKNFNQSSSASCSVVSKTVPRRRSLQVGNPAQQATASNPLCPMGSRSISSKLNTSNVPASHFPGAGRQLGSH